MYENYMSRGEQFQGRKITKISSPPQILIVPFFTYHKKRKNNSIIAQNHAISPSLIYNPSFSESAFLFFPSSIQFHFLFFTYKIESSLDRLFHHSINLFLKRSPSKNIHLPARLNAIPPKTEVEGESSFVLNSNDLNLQAKTRLKR